MKADRVYETENDAQCSQPELLYIDGKSCGRKRSACDVDSKENDEAHQVCWPPAYFIQAKWPYQSAKELKLCNKNSNLEGVVQHHSVLD